MKDIGIGRFKSINSFVSDKLASFRQSGVSFASLFSMMFREKENVMFEKSEGYRIVYTTYAEAQRHIYLLASSIKKTFSDIAPGSIVGLYMDNKCAWIETFWAILASGYRPLLMNLRLERSSLEEALVSCGARAVIAENASFSVRTVEYLSLCDQSADAELSFEDLTFGRELLVMSSGTSEHVKICAYTANELYHQIEGSVQIVRDCGAVKKHYNGSLKLLTFLPFYHVFGLIAVYIWFAFFSRTFVQLNDMAPDTIVNTVKRHGVTHIFAVPLFWEKVYAEAVKGISARGEKTLARFEKGLRVRRFLGDLSFLGDAFSKIAFKEVRENIFGDSISFMITGGSTVSADALAFFNDIGYRLANGYGMTEIGITSVELSRKRSYLVKGCVGLPMKGLEYKIAGDGTLLVRGNSLAAYVIRNGVKTERTGVEEWFETKDLASLYRGHYLINGRSDDLVIDSSGENVNPNLIERELSLRFVRGVCLIGADNEGRTVPTLIVSVMRGLSSEQLVLLDKDLKKAIKEKDLAAFIRRIEYVTDPLLSEGEFKLNRLKIKKLYEAGELHKAAACEKSAVSGANETLFEVIGFFGTALGKSRGEIGPESDFFLDCGGTSLDYFAMITALQERYGLSFPTSEGKSLNTPAEFAAYIEDSRNVDRSV